MKKQRKHHTRKEKIAIPKGRLLEQAPLRDKRGLRLGRTAVQIFAANDRINQILIERERYVNHILREALGQAKYAFAELIISLLASCRC
jgi:hypothetical protein